MTSISIILYMPPPAWHILSAEAGGSALIMDKNYKTRNLYMP